MAIQHGAGPLGGAFSASRVGSAPELRRIRNRAARFLAIFVWCNVPLVGIVALAAHGSLVIVGAAAIAIAAAMTLLVRFDDGSESFRFTMTALVTAAPMTLVSASSGFWGGDWNPYFIVVFALLVAFADWRTIVVAALLTSVFLFATNGSHVHVAAASTFQGALVLLFLVALSTVTLGWFARGLQLSIVNTQAALDQARESFAAREIFEAIVVKGTAGIGVFAGPDGKRTLKYANSVLVEQLNYAGDPIGKTTLELVGPELTRGLVAKLRGDLSDGGRNSLGMFPWQSETGKRWFEIDAYMVESGDGTCLVAATTDVTFVREAESASARAALAEETNHALEREIGERKSAEQRLAHAAYHDTLTGLPNRLALAERLEIALRRAVRQPDRSPAVLFIDLDGFKIVNDTFGHTVADLLLIAVARRFEGCLRGDDTIARVGGDEFVILLDNVSEQAAMTLAGLLLEELAKPFELAERQVSMSASIGVAIATSAHASADELVRDADIAMYRAKTLGKRRCELFVDEMRVRTQRRTRFGIDLQHALARDEFVVHYQPIVSLDTGGLEGFEALVRWLHPTFGLVPPSDFIAIAEETGSIVELGAWVLETACRQLAQWRLHLRGGERVTMSVNVSANQLLTPGFARTVERTLAATGLEPAALHLEITETAVVYEPLRVAQELAELRAFGVSISMDDFGTGYSSLTYLKAFPIDSLKIDKSFVSDRGASIGDPEIVRSLIVLAKSLGLAVVAEGVETPEQEAQLRELGCAKAQGYLFARPLCVEDATAFIVEQARAAPLTA